MLSQYAIGMLSEEQSADLARHLDSCCDCQATITGLEDAEDTLIRRLRMPPGSEACLAEPQFQAAVAEALAVPPQGLMSREESGDGQPASAMPQTLGEYQVLEELGHGGMGRVYKARHTKLDRVVAVKVLPRGRLADPQAITRFEREMRAIGQLAHPNIVQAYDAREIDGTPLLIMEFVDGLDLAEIVRRSGPLPLAEACELVRQTALALQCAHEHGLVHRDIKPSNIMLARPGEVKLLDLGLARFYAEAAAGEEVTGTGQAMGTADYMAPEQTSDSRTVDIRADLYSLGATFYKLLSGRAPFAGATYQTSLDKMVAHRREPVPPIRELRAEIPAGLAAVPERMLAKDPGQRFATPAEVAEAVTPWCAGADLPGLLRRAEASTPSPRLPGEGQGEGGDSVKPLAASQRWKSVIRLAVLLFVGGLGLALGIMIRIVKDGQQTTVDVPPGGTARIGADGQVDVELPASAKSASPFVAPAFRKAGVTRGDLAATVSATGTLEPAQMLDVGAQVSGRIISLGDDPRGKTDPRYKGKSIDFGSPVEPGTILARIDDTLYKLRVEQEKASLARARAELESAKMGKTSVPAAEAAVVQRQVALDQALVSLASTIIKSPIKGVIIDRRVNVGQTVAPDANAPSLFLIAGDLKNMQVWAAVNEADIGRIRPGMEVRFTVDALPGDFFKGKVAQVHMNAQRAQNVVYYTVVVDGFENADRKLMPYMTANLQFQIAARQYQPPPPEPPKEKKSGASATGEERGQAAPQASAPPVVTVSRPIVRDVSDYEEFIGEILASGEAEIRSQATGNIDKLHFKGGMKVKQGDLLLEIDPRSYQAEYDRATAKLEQAKAHFTLLDADFKRAAELLPRQTISQAEYDKAASERDEAKAAVQAAEAAIQLATLALSHTRISAPIAGRISEPLLGVGSTITANNALLAKIVPVDPVCVAFHVPERTVVRLRRIANGKPDWEFAMPVFCGRTDDKDFPYRGKIESVSNQVEAGGMLLWRAMLPNQQGLLMPGMFARVRLVISAPHKALLITERALGIDQGQPFVFVVSDQNIVERRTVKPGQLDDGLRVVTEGLKAEDWVIVSGLQRAHPGMIVRPEKATALSQPPAGQPGESPSAVVTLPPGQPGRHTPPPAAEGPVEKALSAIAEIEFVATPLTDVVDFIADYHKINVSLDKKALKDANIATSIPVKMNLRGIPLRSLLDLTLPQLGLTWAVRDQSLLITTPEAVESHLTTKVYPVSDLTTDSEKLGELIVEIVSSKSWDKNGGMGSVVADRAAGREALVISQSQQAHRRVAEFLADLRTVASQPAAKLPVAVSHEGYWRQTPQTEAVRAALQKKLTIEFDKTPLQDVVDYVRDQSRVNVFLDRGGLASIGVKPSVPVAQRFTDIPLDRLLGMTLKGLGLTYSVEADSLVITSEDTASSRLSAAIYPAGDLVTRGRSVENLVKMLTQTVAPTMWEETGGPGTVIGIKGCADALVVEQTTEVHREIADLLAQLRQPPPSGTEKSKQ
jgi:RND family efflux transporter MFP subunit